MKIFILGANGMFGTYVTKYLSPLYNTIPLTRSDYGDQSKLVTILEYFRKKQIHKEDLIINCVGAIKQKEFNALEMYNLNTLIPGHLSTLRELTGVRVIHVTTDCVFDGRRGNYSEDDIPNAVDIYGVSKHRGEFKNITNIRTSIVGEELHSKKSFIEWLKGNKGKEVNGYTNHFWNGISCLELCGVIHTMIKEDIFWSGIRHITSPSCVSKFVLANIVNEYFKLGLKIIPMETSESINRVLTTKHPKLFNIDDIRSQIESLSKYAIN